MQISKDGLEKFKKLYKKHFGKEIDDRDALEKGINLLTLIKAIYKPMTVKEHKELQERRKETGDIHQCPECGFHYREKEWAEKCEAWCKEHKSCNLEITAHADEDRKI